MKRILAFCIFCCVLLLSACNRVKQMPIESIAPSSSGTASERGNRTVEDLIQEGVVFPVGGLYGKSAEELIRSSPKPIYAVKAAPWNTPVNIIFHVTGDSVLIPYMYDKRTGTFSYACHDPLCLHEDCIWAKSLGSIYCGNDFLYFISDTVSYQDTLYIGDLYGENLRKLYQSDGRKIDPQLVEEGGFVYFLEHLHDEETDQVQTRLMRVPVNGGRAEQLLEEITQFFLPMPDKILYVSKENGNGYLFSLESGESTFFEASIMPRAIYQGWIYYNTDQAFYRASVEDPTVREKVFDHTCSLPLFSGDRLYYIKATAYSKTDAFGIYFKDDLYAAHLDGSDQTLLLTFETDGIPDHVSSFALDGDLLLIDYRTYRDFQNEYNPNGSRLPYRHAIINLKTGERISF